MMGRGRVESGRLTERGERGEDGTRAGRGGRAADDAMMVAAVADTVASEATGDDIIIVVGGAGHRRPWCRCSPYLSPLCRLIYADGAGRGRGRGEEKANILIVAWELVETYAKLLGPDLDPILLLVGLFW